jgi:hypothetical protein
VAVLCVHCWVVSVLSCCSAILVLLCWNVFVVPVPRVWPRVCRLKSLLVLASAVILGSESRGTHDHILPSQIRDSPNLEDQVLVFISPRKDRALAQAVSRWLPTVAARVHIRAACGVHGGQSGIGAGFLRVLRFPLPIIPPISPSS